MLHICKYYKIRSYSLREVHKKVIYYFITVIFDFKLKVSVLKIDLNQNKFFFYLMKTNLILSYTLV